MKLAWDTTTSWLIIEHKTCTNCLGDSLDTSDQDGNETLEWITETPIYVYLDSGFYNNVYFKGRDAYLSQVCLLPTTDSCANDYLFLAATREYGFLGDEIVSGVVGMSPKTQNGPTFIEALYDTGALTSKLFGFSFGV